MLFHIASVQSVDISKPKVSFVTESREQLCREIEQHVRSQRSQMALTDQDFESSIETLHKQIKLKRSCSQTRLYSQVPCVQTIDYCVVQM